MIFSKLTPRKDKPNSSRNGAVNKGKAENYRFKKYISF